MKRLDYSPMVRIVVGGDVAQAMRKWAESKGAVFDDALSINLPDGRVDMPITADTFRSLTTAAIAYGITPFDPDTTIRRLMSLPPRRTH